MYNSEFTDLMDSINNFAKGLGFKNGIDWAQEAKSVGEISYSDYCDYSNVHNLRIRIAHGNARDIAVSWETYQLAQRYYDQITTSSLFKNSNPKYKIPDGGFRSEPFIKDFNISKDGEDYYFKFEIDYEYNYLDDGCGGTYDTGYFIHILEAPYFDYALDRLHEFHIIKESSTEGHICWNKNITSFQEANSIMLIWTKRYVCLITEILKNEYITEKELMKKVGGKGMLPSGTFRSYNKQLSNNKEIYIEKKVYNRIMNKLGILKPELGGMLGFTEDQSVIDTFVFDSGARVNYVEYNPNTNFLNKIIQSEWGKKGISLAGFVHSHPGNFTILSNADVEYAIRIMEAFDLEYLFMPIVTSKYDSKSCIYPYIVTKKGRVEKALLTIYDAEKEMNNNDAIINPNLPINESSKAINTVESIDFEDIDMNLDIFQQIDKEFDSMQYSKKEEQTFDRIQNVVDINYMNKCTIIGIGCGGSRGFFEDMVRVGVGNFILIDGDKSSITNIASQNGYISDIGKFKTDALKARMLDINNKIKINCINEMFNEKLNFERYGINLSLLNKKQTLVCAFTDDFYAQKLAEQMAFELNLPYLSAQHHYAGDTSEATFWYPSVTKYRVKDVLKTRYSAFSNGYVNDVTSEGSPIFNTTRLNALCEKLATGMLLYGLSKTNDYSRFVTEKKFNNIIIIRQKNLAFTKSSLKSLFDENDRSFFDDVLWINPEDIW